MSDAASEIDRLRTALAAAEARADAAEVDLAQARAVVSSAEAMISALKLEIAKLRRAQYGKSSERRARLIDQLELQLEELETAAAEDEARAADAPRKTSTVRAFERRRPSRKPFPEHLPRERVVIEAPAACGCCGSGRIVKLGEDVTETLEVIPRQWKVIQTVREKFSCRQCEAISQPPAPFHVTPRGFAGPNLLAMVLFEKFSQHQPLNRQSERYAREGVELSLSTLADHRHRGDRLRHDGRHARRGVDDPGKGGGHGRRTAGSRPHWRHQRRPRPMLATAVLHAWRSTSECQHPRRARSMRTGW